MKFIHKPFAKQKWQNILFIHFPLPKNIVEPLIPSPFRLNTYDGKAWISIVYFKARESRLNMQPKFLAYPSFQQINVRTYVTFGRKKGIYFLFLDATRKLPVKIGEIFSLPYFYAQIQFQKSDQNLYLKSYRNEQSFFTIQAEGVFDEKKMNDKDFVLFKELTERYVFWWIDRQKIYEALLTHEPWRNPKQVRINLSLEHKLSIFQQVNSSRVFAQFVPEKMAYLHPIRVKALFQV